MSIAEKIAWANGILLVVSEALPLIKTDITEADSVLQLIGELLKRFRTPQMPPQPPVEKPVKGSSKKRPSKVD
jgi:hypothetical protein